MAKPKKPTRMGNSPEDWRKYNKELIKYYKDLADYHSSDEYLQSLKNKVDPNYIKPLKNAEKKRETINKYKEGLEKETGKKIDENTGGALMKFLDYLQRPQYAIQNMMEDLTEGYKPKDDIFDNTYVFSQLYESARAGKQIFDNLVSGKVDPVEVIKEGYKGLIGERKNSFIKMMNKWNPPKDNIEKFTNAAFGFLADVFVDPLNLPASVLKPLKTIKYLDNFNDYALKGFKAAAKTLDLGTEVKNIKNVDDIIKGVKSVDDIAKLSKKKQKSLQILKNSFSRVITDGKDILSKSHDRGVVRDLFKGVDRINDSIKTAPRRLTGKPLAKEIKDIIDIDVKNALMPARTRMMKATPNVVSEILDTALTTNKFEEPLSKTSALLAIPKGVANLVGDMLEVPFPSAVKGMRKDISSVSNWIRKAFSTSTGIDEVDEAIRASKIELSPMIKKIDDKIDDLAIKSKNLFNSNKVNFANKTDFNTKLRNYIVTGGKEEIPKVMKELGDEYINAFKNISKVDSALFQTKGLKGKYFPAITTPEFRDFMKKSTKLDSIKDIDGIDEFLINTEKLKKLPKEMPKHLGEQVIDITKLDDLNKFIADKHGVKMLEDDVLNVISKRFGGTKFAVNEGFTVNKLVGRLAEVKPKNPSEYVKIPESWMKTYKVLEDKPKKMYIPKNIFKTLKQVNEVMVNPKHTSPLIRTYDKITRGLKKWTLLPFGSYHMRNLSGNILNASLSGQPVTSAITGNIAAGGNLLGYAFMKNKDELIRKFPKFKSLINKMAIKDNGKTANLIEEAFQYGVLDKGFVSQQILQDVERVFSSKKSIPSTNKFIRAFFNIAKSPEPAIDAATGTVAKIGGGVGKWVEDTGRLSLYKWAKNNFDKALKHVPVERIGDTVEDGAARIVDMYLFDYSDLSKFERDVLNRLAFFYTFFRKNLPLQIESFIRNPEIAVKYKKGIDAIGQTLARRDPNDPEISNEWMNAPVYLGYDKEEDEYKIWDAGTWIPAETLMDVFGDEKLNALLNMMNPILKEPIQQGMNYNSFWESPIQAYEGQKYNLFNLWKAPIRLQSVLFNARPIKSADKIIKRFAEGKANSETLVETLTKMGIEAFVGKTYKGSKNRVVTSLYYDLMRENQSIQRDIYYAASDAGIDPEERKEMSEEELMKIEGIAPLMERIDLNKAIQLRLRQEMPEDHKLKLDKKFRTASEQKTLKKRKAKKYID